MAPPIDGLERDTLASGAVAGFSTGLFSIPEGMAYAQLAGVNPLYGLYSGMVATLAASLTTGTVLMVSTLTSAIALSTGSVLAVADIHQSQLPAALFTVTLLTGAVMLVLGLLRLGSLVSFVSNSVMTGFVIGASLLIVIGELGDFSGYAPEGPNKVAQVLDWFRHLGSWDGATTATALATVALVVVGKQIAALERWAPILALVAMTVVVTVIDPASVATVADIASIPRGLPKPLLPDFSAVPELALGSVSVAIVALVQGAGISTAYPNPDGSPASASRDFVGQGLGNLAGAFFQSLPTGGSLSRTGVSVSGGARSRWGGVFAALWIGLLVLLFGKVAEAVPLSVIAGLLFVIGGELIAGRATNAVLALRSSTGSAAALLATFGAALFIPLQWTIFLGAGISLVVYLASSVQRGTLQALERTDDGYWREGPAPDSLTDGQVTVLGLRHVGFFAEVPRLERLLPAPDSATGAVVVLRLRSVPDVNSTGLRALEDYRQALERSGNHLVLAGVQHALATTLRRVQLWDRIGDDRIFAATADITASLDAAVARARQLTAADEG